MKFDLETFSAHFLTMIQGGMAAKLSEISTEKGDSIPLVNPENGHYVHTINDKGLNFDPFIHYGFSNIDTVTNGAGLAWIPTMFFACYFLHHGAGEVAEKKVFRYTRAMTEIVAANISANAYLSNIRILPLPPAIVILDAMDGSEYKVGGIEITASFNG